MNDKKNEKTEIIYVEEIPIVTDQQSNQNLQSVSVSTAPNFAYIPLQSQPASSSSGTVLSNNLVYPLGGAVQYFTQPQHNPNYRNYIHSNGNPM